MFHYSLLLMSCYWCIMISLVNEHLCELSMDIFLINIYIYILMLAYKEACATWQRQSSSLHTHDHMVFVVRTGREHETWKQICKHTVDVLLVTVKQTCQARYSLFNQVKVITGAAVCANHGDTYSVRCCARLLIISGKEALFFSASLQYDLSLGGV